MFERNWATNFTEEETINSFPPSLRDDVRKVLGENHPINPIATLNARQDIRNKLTALVKDLPGIGETRAQNIICNDNEREYWALHWLNSVRQIRNKPEELLQIYSAQAYVNNLFSRAGREPVILYTRPVVQTLREWVASWEDGD